MTSTMIKTTGNQ